MQKIILSFILMISVCYGADINDMQIAQYGGRAGHGMFQITNDKMPGFLAHNVRAGQNFSQLVRDAVAIRHDLAIKTGTNDADKFGQLRKNGDVGQFGNLSPVCKYPLMRRLLKENLRAFTPCADWIPLDNEQEYRFLTKTVLGWLTLIQAANGGGPINALGSLMLPIIMGDSKYMWLFDVECSKDAPDGFRYNNQLKTAFENAKSGIDTPGLTVSYLEVRFAGSDLPQRGVIFPKDERTAEDLSDVPFILVHPAVVACQAHWDLCDRVFEMARHADEPRKAAILIATFQYWWALAMPIDRGSAAIGEWLTEALFLKHGLRGLRNRVLVFSEADQIAQATFTRGKFLEQYFELFNRPEIERSLVVVQKQEKISPLSKIYRVKANLLFDQIKTILIVSPPVVTGGPENMCQIYAAARDRGFDVHMLWMCDNFFQTREEAERTFLTYRASNDLTPERFRNLYGAASLGKEVVLDDHTLVVLPEVATDYAPLFAPAKVWIEWLSLSNFFGSQCNFKFKQHITDGTLGSLDVTHTYQAPWIGKQLSEWGVHSYPLYDYVSQKYLERPTLPKKPYSVAYFPRKGGELATQLIDQFKANHPDRSYEWVRLENLDVQGMFDCLSQSGIYIDFGHFPGRDRTPREAALLKNVILIHRAGCATDYDSFSLDSYFTFDAKDIESGVLRKKIEEICDNYPFFQARQQVYRSTLLGEKAVFERQFEELIGNPFSA